MGAVAVAQHLHAMAVSFNNNNVTGGIERDARGTFELAGACSSAADGADMRAVAVAQHLHAVVVSIGNNKVAFGTYALLHLLQNFIASLQRRVHHEPHTLSCPDTCAPVAGVIT